MRLQEIINIATEYFPLALVAVIALGFILFVTYFIVYKKVLKGKKHLPIKRVILLGLFIGYVVMVIGVTFLNRGPDRFSGIDLSLFSSYREAWYRFSVSNWQFI